MSLSVYLALQPTNCLFKITGRKENAEEAKRRIINQADRLVSLIVIIHIGIS